MSAVKTIFYQECPTCGRSLRIPVKYFGLAMACTHCGGEFVANPDAGREGGGQNKLAPPLQSSVETAELAALANVRARAS